jgi:hypothetical protein
MAGEWRPDPAGRHQWRWWDDHWTDLVGDQGATSTDPYVAPAPAPITWKQTHRLLMLGGGALIVIGSLGPWAKVSLGVLSRSFSGTSGDGVITLIAGIVVLVFSFLDMRNPASKVFLWLVLAAGLVALGVAAYDGFNIQRFVNETNASQSLVSTSLGWGVVVCGVGGAAAVAGLVIGFEQRQNIWRATRGTG